MSLPRHVRTAYTMPSRPSLATQAWRRGGRRPPSVTHASLSSSMSVRTHTQRGRVIKRVREAGPSMRVQSLAHTSRIAPHCGGSASSPPAPPAKKRAGEWVTAQFASRTPASIHAQTTHRQSARLTTFKKTRGRGAPKRDTKGRYKSSPKRTTLPASTPHVRTHTPSRVDGKPHPSRGFAQLS